MDRQSGQYRGGHGRGQSRGSGQSRGGGQFRGGGQSRGGQSRGDGQYHGGDGQYRGDYRGDGQYRGDYRGDGQYRGEYRGDGHSRGRGQSRDGGQYRQGSRYQGESHEGGPSSGEHHQGQTGQRQYQEERQSRGGYSQRGQSRGGQRGRGGGGFQQGGGQGFPTRSGPLVVPKDPPTGTKGRSITLETNYLPLNLKKFYDKQIFQHDVAIEPSRFKRLLPKVMDKFKQEYFPNECTVFDGSKFLLSLKQLPEYCEEVAFTSDGYSKPINFKVKIQYTKPIDLDFFQNFRANPDMKKMTEASQVLSIILRGYHLMRHLAIGRNFYIRPQQTIDLSHDMELLFGLYQAPVLTQRGPLLNVDILNKAHPIEMNKDEHMNEKGQKLLDLICNICNFRDIPDRLTESQIRCILDVVKGKKVAYTIKGQQTFDYKVNGFRKSPVEEIIPNENISVQNYFLKKKQYKIRYPNLQLLWVGKAKREIKILIPVELCVFKAGQMTKRGENHPDVVRNIISKTISTTEERKQKIMNMVREIGNYSESPYLKDFGIEVGTEFELIQGRVLDPPELKYSNTITMPERGKWDGRGKQFFVPSVIEKWTIINMDLHMTVQAIMNLSNEIQKLARNYGITISPPQKTENINPRSPKLPLDLRTKFDQLKDYKLFIVVFNDRNLYRIIKQQAELNVGCLTQCLLSKTISNSRTITTNLSNLLLKINAKCNGINHILDRRPAFLKGNIMVMGADVTHPPPGSQSIPSYAAVTASHDCDLFRFNMVCQMQLPTEENIIGLKEITLKQLKFYYTNTKRKPDHIIFFRDGVSEGQFEDTVATEVKAVKDACHSLPNYNPLITFVVVMKRHHTRLFPTDARDTYDKFHNVPAGTCVDTGITHPVEMELKDFYLASHAAIQGVTKPTKYCTLYDDANLTYDNIEELAYYLCHMYTRCTRSVSYPAPTYYAHLAADRAKILCQMQEIDWTRLDKEKKIEIEIKNGNAPMHFV